MTSQAAQHLKQIPIFSKLTDEERTYILNRLEVTSLVAGETLFQQGAEGDAMYVVMEGEISLTKAGRHGQEILLQTAVPGDTFGELSLIDNSPRAATATATADSYLFCLSRKDFLYLLTQHPTVTLDILADVAKKLRSTGPGIQKHHHAPAAAGNPQAQTLTQLKSAFIGLVSRELQTPFSEVDASLQLIQRGGYHRLTPSQQSQFETLINQVDELKERTSKLTKTAAFLLEQGPLEITAVSIRQLLRQVLTQIKPLMDAKAITLSVQMSNQAISLQGDASRLAEALHQLLHNAYKFTDPHGRVILRCKATAEYVIFEVEDNGCGIPKGKLKTLWKAHHQLTESTPRQAQHIGLGLAIVSYIAKAHGGRVWADSTLGLGSTLGFAIPHAS